jgi:uncharacterized protein YabE (DUF348 family)
MRGYRVEMDREVINRYCLKEKKPRIVRRGGLNVFTTE